MGFLSQCVSFCSIYALYLLVNIGERFFYNLRAALDLSLVPGKNEYQSERWSVTRRNKIRQVLLHYMDQGLEGLFLPSIIFLFH